MSPEVFIQLVQLGATGLLAFMLWSMMAQQKTLIEAANANQALLIKGLLGLLTDGVLPSEVLQKLQPPAG